MAIEIIFSFYIGIMITAFYVMNTPALIPVFVALIFALPFVCFFGGLIIEFIDSVNYFSAEADYAAQRKAGEKHFANDKSLPEKDHISKIQKNIDNNKLCILKNGFEDAATSNLGGACRMPTILEWIELSQKCTWKWKYDGYEVIGPNGNSIFLPKVDYWSSTLYTYLPGRACYFHFDSNLRYTSSGNRCLGKSVRPVYT
jgi:hypothetical protein